MVIALDMKGTYEKMDGNTAALYTYIYNLNFSVADIDELRDRVIHQGHKLSVNDMGGIEELDSDGEVFAQLDDLSRPE